MTTPLATKQAFYAAWRAGLLGNKPRTWATLDDLLASDYRGPVNIRTIGAGGGGATATRYGVEQDVLPGVLAAWSGVPTMNEPAPDDVLLIQGEIMRGVEGLCLRFSTVRGLRMNEAMRDPHTRDVRGLVAKMILDHFLDPSSRDDIDALLDLYPDHVIEFSTHGCNVGDCPHRNTFIWEVRAF